MISISVTADKYSRNVLSVLYKYKFPLFSTKYMINKNIYVDRYYYNYWIIMMDLFI